VKAYFFNYFLLLFFLVSCKNQIQDNIQVISFDELYNTIDLSSDGTYVINFWATWCSPCIKELPHFEYVNNKYDSDKVKVILVSLDLPYHYNSKLVPFVKVNNIQSKVVQLADNDSYSWMSEISKEWDGGIPATLIINSTSQKFYPKPFDKDELIYEIEDIMNKNIYLNGLGSR
tara:strand:+ start:1056 stop:1577 length:522 start_codon:yes stop_codon:yes gene_type:complete